MSENKETLKDVLENIIAGKFTSAKSSLTEILYQKTGATIAQERTQIANKMLAGKAEGTK